MKHRVSIAFVFCSAAISHSKTDFKCKSAAYVNIRKNFRTFFCLGLDTFWQCLHIFNSLVFTLLYLFLFYFLFFFLFALLLIFTFQLQVMFFDHFASS
jgi:hypothetical protein